MCRNKIFKVDCPELPVVKKCCYFIPVRRGVIIFAYINLTVSLLALPLLVFLLVAQLSDPAAARDQAAVPEPAALRDPARLPAALLCGVVDAVASLLLIVAAHKKNRTLLKVYLYFGIAFEVLQLFLDLVLFGYGDYLENLVYFFFLSLNVYLLYLVYSTIHVLKETSEVRYVAHEDPI